MAFRKGALFNLGFLLRKNPTTEKYIITRNKLLPKSSSNSEQKMLHKKSQVPLLVARKMF